MHAKSDSDVTSMATMSPPRSPSRSRAVYYVESPSFSQHDNLDKLSYATLSPNTSPTRQFQYHCSPIHHSRESSTSRLFSSSSLKHQYGRSSGWRRIYGGRRLGEERDCHGGEEDEEEDDDGGGGPSLRFYVGCFLVSFVVLFTVFSVILWGAAKSFHPHILVKVCLLSLFIFLRVHLSYTRVWYTFGKFILICLFETLILNTFC